MKFCCGKRKQKKPVETASCEDSEDSSVGWTEFSYFRLELQIPNGGKEQEFRHFFTGKNMEELEFKKKGNVLIVDGKSEDCIETEFANRFGEDIIKRQGRSKSAEMRRITFE